MPQTQINIKTLKKPKQFQFQSHNNPKETKKKPCKSIRSNTLHIPFSMQEQPNFISTNQGKPHIFFFVILSYPNRKIHEMEK